MLVLPLAVAAAAATAAAEPVTTSSIIALALDKFAELFDDGVFISGDKLFEEDFTSNLLLLTLPLLLPALPSLLLALPSFPAL